MVSQGSFRLDVEEGSFTDSEILVMLGENGTGKTTFIRMLAGMLPPDDEERTEVPEFNVSYKPQKISPKFTSTVRNGLCCQAHCHSDSIDRLCNSCKGSAFACCLLLQCPLL